ncbi:MerR family transcriptional regulator [Inconstantimicrobium mannanitabidum]|uniref:MerR family transcriptional regulator n=1 Tax=Inconstantimicrobium mannanitabidum TaxID=1604901 RepID=A0ACB5R7S0_9CLOT|nr:MerR family transcriptional regulator [Clostridium sp. TW13]GKX65212.1 MerR family transcriptional regulator [Clostridium sp. TW13]
MTIKEASEITGISIDNLRYYERIGLIPEVPRTASGIRDYDEMSLHWIDFAMRFKRGGMPLEAIREYIQLAINGEETKPARKEILLEAKEDLEKKMAEIQESLDVINYKLDIYDKKCEPITIEMVNKWKEKQREIENKK